MSVYGKQGSLVSGERKSLKRKERTVAERHWTEEDHTTQLYCLWVPQILAQQRLRQGVQADSYLPVGVTKERELVLGS